MISVTLPLEVSSSNAMSMIRHVLTPAVAMQILRRRSVSKADLGRVAAAVIDFERPLMSVL